ncbi:uncharacterized protein LOC120143149 [Hibiscus syriacus]|uniref:uncharacterized protein LOC120143149 n=1 Tax=Hibiscus syriacus TaxID=106335 RepID=UPI001920AA27|nr:uncharacterized protein LOC120143149 [Hibiscus syriacus]
MSKTMDSGGTSPEITHPFACTRCPRRFTSWHALGDHQNAHKKERNEKQRLYNERRLAFKKQSPPVVTIPPAEPVIAILNSYSPAGSNGGPMDEVSRREIGNSRKAGNRKGMALNLFGHEGREDGGADESNAKEEEDLTLRL